MYALLGLLVMVFVSVHGEMIQCIVGGIVDNSLMTDQRQYYCNKMENDSVLNKSYLSYIGLYILHHKNDVRYDTPFLYREDKDYSTYIYITERILKRQKETSNFGHSAMRLFITNESIVETWNNIVEMGTDLHRLKFHSKLLTLFKNNYDFSYDEVMIFLKSNFSAVGIYYFSRNKLAARYVSADGLQFLNHMKSKLYVNNDNDVEVVMWELLTNLVYYEMHSDYDTSTIKYIYNNSNINYYLAQIKRFMKVGKYPCSYLFMFRGMLLDIHQYFTFTEPWIELSKLINDGSITICENDSDNKTLRVYMDIILSRFLTEDETIPRLTAFSHLINALKSPLFTSEDRLLNYKATNLAITEIAHCIGISGWHIEGSDLCREIEQNYRKMDSNLDRILNKLTHIQIYRIIEDYMPNFIFNDDTLNESKLHMIVTMAIDIIDTETGISLTPINIVKLAIKSLHNYIQRQNENMYHNLMIAYKWLAELYGVQCTDSSENSKNYRIQLDTALSYAVTLQMTYNIEDEHLEFLHSKYICKQLYPPYSWEKHYKADGWIPNINEDIVNNSILLNGNDCDVTKFLESNSPFIHQADVNILMIRKLFWTNEEFVTLFYIRNALLHPVISPEDRVRNFQAHEFFSMYVLWRNYQTINNLDED